MSSTISRIPYLCYIHRNLLSHTHHHCKPTKPSSPSLPLFHGFSEILQSRLNSASQSIIHLGCGTHYSVISHRYLCSSSTVNHENPASKKPIEINSGGGENSGDSNRTGDAGKSVRGGPVSWLSFLLLISSGAGLVFYYDKEKKQHIEVLVVISSSNNSYSTIDKDMTETRHITESNPSKAQLLEALRHSQTRAREAEKAAQQAYTEKEHIIKLFFRQASHLFAYKQWFRLLQLETLCLQLKNKDQPISTLFPVVLPWMPCKGRQMRKSRRKGSKGKRAPSKYDISKYAVAFAVGLSLAGAGLLLGWTMGWLLPTF